MSVVSLFSQNDRGLTAHKVDCPLGWCSDVGISPQAGRSQTQPPPSLLPVSGGNWTKCPHSQESLPMAAIAAAESRCMYGGDTTLGPVLQLEAGTLRQKVKVWARLLRPFRPVDLPNVKPAMQSEQGLIEAEASPGAVASAGPGPEMSPPEFCVASREG